MNSFLKLVPLCLGFALGLTGCSTTAVRQLGEATAANTTLVSGQIARMDASRRSFVGFEEALLTRSIARTTGKQARVDLQLQLWKATGEGGLVEDFENYQRLSDARYKAPEEEAAATASRQKRIDDKLPAASGNGAQLEALGKLLAALTPKESLLDTLKRYGDYWTATKKLIDEAVKQADEAAKKADAEADKQTGQVNSGNEPAA